jgi:PIN domain nuclease of toxin-antitoxin system
MATFLGGKIVRQGFPITNSKWFSLSLGKRKCCGLMEAKDYMNEISEKKWKKIFLINGKKKYSISVS